MTSTVAREVLTDVEEIRFFGGIVRGDGCWEWLGQKNNHGYGIFYARRGGKTVKVLAHRISYVMFVGPIPEDEEIDHVKTRGCVSRSCTNPEHLESVTHQENCARTDPHNQNLGKTHCIRGHLFDDVNTRLEWNFTKGAYMRVCRICKRERNKVNKAKARRTRVVMTSKAKSTAKGKPKTAPPSGTSPTTAVGGGKFVSKGKKRKSASHNNMMGGQGGMKSANQAGTKPF